MAYGFNDDKSKYDITQPLVSLNNSIVSIRTDINDINSNITDINDNVTDINEIIDNINNFISETRNKFVLIQGEKLLTANDIVYVQFTREQLANLGISNIDNYVVISSMWQPGQYAEYSTPDTWIYNDGVPFTSNGYTSKFRIEMSNNSEVTYPLLFAMYSTTDMTVNYRVVLMKVA